MKTSSLALAAAAVLSGVQAHQAHHAHDIFHAKKALNDTGVYSPTCTTVYYTITGDIIWTPTPGPIGTPSTASAVPVVTTATAVLSTPAAVLPTPVAQTCPTPGTYTFPATTLTVTETATVCAPSTTPVTAGTYTVGGVTTVVTTATTIVCPYATTSPSGTDVTSIIKTTTYVCPSAGTYTIAPITTTVTVPTTTITVPVVSTITPGVYTAPAVTTVVTTQTIVYCPFASSAVSAPTNAVTPPAASTAPAASIPASSSPAASLGGNGKQWAITYTPYSPHSGACKSASEVMADVTKIAGAGFTSLRVYSTDCDTLPNVGAAAAANGLKIIAGIFISGAGCGSDPNVASQIAALAAWARWDLVEMVVVGNEALFNGYCTPGELASLITSTKATLGYTGPYTTTDTVAGWQKDGVASAICGVVDFPAANIHAYFNSETAPADAGPFVQSQLSIVESLCGKSGVVLESGYPKEGVCNGMNCPSVNNQESALMSIQSTMGSKVVFFSLFDDQWKGASSCGCETSFGCGPLFGVN